MLRNWARCSVSLITPFRKRDPDYDESYEEQKSERLDFISEKFSIFSHHLSVAAFKTAHIQQTGLI